MPQQSSHSRCPLAGLYAITDPALCPEENLIKQVTAAVTGGARVIQYRNKNGKAQQKYRQAEALAVLAKQLGTCLIINDDVELAISVDADGVHLGQRDTRVGEARRRLGGNKIIGATCHGDLALAKQAVRAGADYVAFGRFFASKTKPHAPLASLAMLHEARAQLKVPIIAIGGITRHNAKEVIAAGAHMTACAHGVFGDKNIKENARRMSQLFEESIYRDHTDHIRTR